MSVHPVYHDLPSVTLRPGHPVLNRDDSTVQVGVGVRTSVRLPRHPDVVALLADLQAGRPARPTSATASAALHTLRVADLLCPADGASAAARAHFGSDAVRREQARTAHQIGVRADPPALRVVTELLDAAGLVHDDDDASVWLLVSASPLSRARVDPLQRAGAPHLIVTATGAQWRVGPFVEPGRTACLRCVDSHEASADPRLPLLIEQAAQHPDPPPVDPLLERFALNWAVRDLARWAEGDEPGTWSATVDIGPGGVPEATRHLRHPDCGCAWDTLFLPLP